MAKITVLLPVTVPDGPMCWNFKSGDICQHFENEGGWARCELFGNDLDMSDNGAYKLAECAKLQKVDE